MKTYTIEWKNSKGKSCVCTIYDTTRSRGTNTQINAADYPFIVEMDGDNDPFKPMRYQTAEISVLCTIEDIISVSSDTTHRVVLTVDNAVKWLGWLTANTIDQQYDSYIHKVSYNAIDDLGWMRTQKIDTQLSLNTIKSSFVDMYSRFLNKAVNNEQALYYGYGVPTAAGISDPLTYQTQKDNWYNKVEEDNEIRYEAKHYDEMLTDLMHLLGSTIISDGVNWYITSVEDYSMLKMSSSITPSENANFTSVDFSDLTPAGSHQITKLNKCKKVQFTAGGEEISYQQGADIPKIETNSLNRICHGYGHAYSGTTTEVRWYAVMLGDTIDRGFETHRYHVNENGTWGSELTYQPGTNYYFRLDDVNGKNALYYGGATFLRQDLYLSSEHDSKTNYDFEDVIYLLQSEQVNSSTTRNMSKTGTTVYSTSDNENLIIEAKTMMSQTLNKKLLTIKSIGDVQIKAGGIIIDFDVYCQDKLLTGSGNYIQRTPFKHPGHQVSLNSGKMLAMLRFGENWWNGSEWKTYETKFYIDITSANKCKDTKKLEMDFSGAGCCIEIPYTMQGVMEFSIYGVADTTFKMGSQISQFYADCVVPEIVQIRNFDFKYAEPFGIRYMETVIGDAKPQKTWYRSNDGGQDEIQVSTSLCTDAGQYSNTGTLYYLNSKVSQVSKVNEQGVSVNGICEVLTSDRIKNIMFSTREYLTLCVDDSTEITPLTILSNEDNEAYKLLRIDDRDFTNNTITATFLKK